jgi:uncharacterized iron-regulated membrane protein
MTTRQQLRDQPVAFRRRSVWIHTPQRSRLRKALFQIHLWVGVVLGIYAIAIGITGSLLVFSSELELRLEPHLHVVQPEARMASLQKVWETVRATHPNDRIFSLVMADEPDHSASFVLAPRQSKLDRSRIRSVYFNPHTGEILGEQTTVEGALGWVRNLHYFLFGGETGLLVNGAMGLGLLLLCLSGIVIWWPGILRWKRSMTVTHRANWKRFNWDLHSAVGFWSCAALLVVSFTGVYFAFPKAVTMLTLVGTRSDRKQPQRPAAPLAASQHAANAPALTLDQIIAIGQDALSKNAPLSYIALPVVPGGIFSVGQYRSGSAPYSQLSSVDIDPYSGRIVSRFNTAQYPIGMRVVQYYHAIHFGSFGGQGVFGLVVKIVWCILGLVPAVLGITGFLMYWNRFLKKRWIAIQQ